MIAACSDGTGPSATPVMIKTFIKCRHRRLPPPTCDFVIFASVRALVTIGTSHSSALISKSCSPSRDFRESDLNHVVVSSLSLTTEAICFSDGRMSKKWDVVTEKYHGRHFFQCIAGIPVSQSCSGARFAVCCSLLIFCTTRYVPWYVKNFIQLSSISCHCNRRGKTNRLKNKKSFTPSKTQCMFKSAFCYNTTTFLTRRS